MLLNSLSFRTGGQCTLTLEQAEGWLCATWAGYVGAAEALQGAANYLNQVGPTHCLYLLNDNTALRGPWFVLDPLARTRLAPPGQAPRAALRGPRGASRHPRRYYDPQLSVTLRGRSPRTTTLS